MPSILMLYGKFLIHVLNEKGGDLIKKSKRIAYRQLEGKKAEQDDLENLADPVAMLISSTHKGDHGYIKKTNLMVSSLFGHYKEELVDKKINMLMPNIYAAEHDRFLNAFVEANSDVSSYLDKDQKFLCKNKSGYIFPVNVKTKLFFPGESEDQAHFMTSFKVEMSQKAVIYFILDNNDVLRLSDLRSSSK